MSSAVFQSALSRLVVAPEFRDQVLAEVPEVLALDLTPRERLRLRQVAGDPGLATTRTLHQGFRLGKLLAFLPLTCKLLGEERLATELEGFWRERLPQSFYFLEESLAFCDRILAGGLRDSVPFLSEVAAYERAALELQRPRTGNEPPIQLVVAFEHDPVRLLGELAKGEIPVEIEREPCLLVGRRAPDGGLEWRVRRPRTAAARERGSSERRLPAAPGLT